MRRRRKKNPLLTRIIVVSIAAHAIALPIAAHFGAFEKVRREFGSSKLVVINTPPLEEKKAAEKAKKAQKPQRTESKRSSAPAHRSGSSSKANPNAVKVESAAGGTDDGNGPTADANATGHAGVLPIGPTTAPPSNVGKQPDNITPPQPPPSKPVETVTPPPPEKNPTPPPPALPKPKKFAQVETTYAPEPVIPDDLRSESFEKTAIVEADVNASGLPENVKIAESCGSKELDDIGLDTAKKYRFKAATLDDEPVVGHVRFKIIFKVE